LPISHGWILYPESHADSCVIELADRGSISDAHLFQTFKSLAYLPTQELIYVM